MKKKLTRYVFKHYLGTKNLCSLCGNHGIIDTRGMQSPAGVECGRLNWCICPNGQALRKQTGLAAPKKGIFKYDNLEVYG